MDYAESIRDGRKVACMELKQAVDRFFADLDNPEYVMDYKGPEFCIQIIEKTFCHQQGERIDGTPLRGTPFLLEPFHKFIIYNSQTVCEILRIESNCYITSLHRNCDIFFNITYFTIRSKSQNIFLDIEFYQIVFVSL